MISHDFEYVKKYADNVILLDRTIVKEGVQKKFLKVKNLRKSLVIFIKLRLLSIR